MQKKDFEKIRFYFFTGLLIVATVSFFVVVKPMLYPIFWAGVLAWIFRPLYLKIYAHLFPHRSIASFFAVTLIVLLFIIPLSGILFLIVRQAFELYQASETQISELYARAKSLIDNFGNVELVRLMERSGVDIQQKLIEYTRLVSSFVVSGIAGFTGSAVRFFIGFFIMLYTLYYFLKDGDWMVKKILHLSPLDSKSEKIITDKFTSVIRATMRGTFLVAIIQGTIGGIVLWIAGVTAPAFWALIMTIFALLPSVAPGTITFPAAIILLIQGKIWEGVFVLVFGVVFVGIVDNILRPYLVGRDIHMHPLFIFFSTIGGLIVFGISGFVIGPILASLLIALWNIYENKFKKELDHARL